MSPLRPDKTDTKANDYDRTCVTASWFQFQQCHAPVYMPKVGKAVGPHVKLCSRLSRVHLCKGGWEQNLPLNKNLSGQLAMTMEAHPFARI